MDTWRMGSTLVRWMKPCMGNMSFEKPFSEAVAVILLLLVLVHFFFFFVGSDFGAILELCSSCGHRLGN